MLKDACFNEGSVTQRRNTARKLRAGFESVVKYEDRKERFRIIVGLENWHNFSDYYFNPEKEPLSSASIKRYEEIEEVSGEPVYLEPFTEIEWDRDMILEMILEGTFDDRIQTLDAQIFQDAYENTGDSLWLEKALELGWDIELGRADPQNIFHHISIYNSLPKPRNGAYAKEVKNNISKCLGGIPIKAQSQFEMLRRDSWRTDDYIYEPGEILCLDVGTKWIDFRHNWDDENRRKMYLYHQKPFRSMGYHWFGTLDSGHTSNPAEIQALIDKAKMIVTYNGLRFDQIVLESIGIEIPDSIHHYDIYDCIARFTNIRKSLNYLTFQNGVPEKDETSSSNGVRAEKDAQRTSAIFYLLTHAGLSVEIGIKIFTSIVEGIKEIPTSPYDEYETMILNKLYEMGVTLEPLDRDVRV